MLFIIHIIIILIFLVLLLVGGHVGTHWFGGNSTKPKENICSMAAEHQAAHICIKNLQSTTV